jgi:hypothetical protein
VTARETGLVVNLAEWFDNPISHGGGETPWRPF